MHTHALINLKEYNLFCNKQNTLIYNALLMSDKEIKIQLKETLSENEQVLLFDNTGKNILKKTYFRNKNCIILEGKFNLSKNYFIQIQDEKAKVILNPDIGGILDTHFYCTDTDFGINFTRQGIHFKLWSPPAVQVELLLYDREQKPVETDKPVSLKNTKPGIWETTLKPEYENYLYQYKITAYGEQYIALDPYAKAMAAFYPDNNDIIGKAAILNIKSKQLSPKNFKKSYKNFKYIENETDIIIYEVNLRDFTVQPGTVDTALAGTFKGLIKKIPYLQELGITHIQLMPVNKAYTQAEHDRTYTGKSAKQSNYNWGYDPMNYFSLEGRYATNPDNPAIRILEFKEMVQALHDAGIGVILDVVFNHTYTAASFENIAPACYYRLKDDYFISEHTGAGASVESRHLQVRKFITDVLKFYVNEYHIDGFRFDLMSFHDKETMRHIRKEVGAAYNPKNPNELILHGEAWNFTDLKNDAFIKTDYESLHIGIFNDTFRDALSGNKHTSGFILGNTQATPALASAIAGATESFAGNCLPYDKNIFFNSYNLFAKHPGDCLNFLSVHDGMTLWDKINLQVNDPSKNERLRLMKLAYSVLLTSQGKILLHGGDEILRTKPLADFDKEKHRALSSEFINEEEKAVSFHENSYISNDFTNMFRWDRLTNEYAPHAKDLLQYVKGLIKLRRTFSAFRFSTASELNQNFSFLNEGCKDENRFHSFKSAKLKKLCIKFINGIPNSRLFLVGETHKLEANPRINQQVLLFDKNGQAKITFDQAAIKSFDLKKWDESRNLNIKLVQTPGEWDYPEKFYSQFGNNALSPESIDKDFTITLDLSIRDYKNTTHQDTQAYSHIAFFLKNNKPHQEYEKFIVIHNGSAEPLNFSCKEIAKLKNPVVLVDNKNAGITPLKHSEVQIKDNTISVPRKTSSVIAGK